MYNSTGLVNLHVFLFGELLHLNTHALETDFYPFLSTIFMSQRQSNVLVVVCSHGCVVYFQVDPYSVAAKDGRIREGDQIVQVRKHLNWYFSGIVCSLLFVCLNYLRL